jgi:UDP-N-acetyl-D-mannosaminuronate dehydrogenase
LEGGDGLGQSEAAVSINDQMPRYAFEFLERRYPFSLDEKKVLLLGVSYRGDVGDTRFSPVEPFCRCLLRAGAHVLAHDPYVRDWPGTGISPLADIDEALASGPEIVVICTGHRLYRREETVRALFVRDPMWIYDTIGLLPAEQINKLRERHTFIVLGRGDL